MSKQDNHPQPAAFQAPSIAELKALGIPLDVQMVDSTATIEDLRKADVAVANLNLFMLYKAWDSVYTTGQAIDLANASVAMCAKRRALLNQPIGAPEAKAQTLGKLIPI